MRRRLLACLLSAALIGGCLTVGVPSAHAQGGDYANHPTVAAVGTATYHGSTGPLRLNAPIKDMVATANDGGYWLLAQDGGVFAYGNAGFYGSTGSMVLNKPVQAMAATASGNGYWFVASDGGVFAFGDAGFVGSIPGVLKPGQRLNAPVVGLVPTSSGEGYWMVASDGGVFAFGDAGFVGSLGGTAIPAPIVAFVPTPSNGGYWMVDRVGRTYGFGDAPHVGTVPPCSTACVIQAGAHIVDAVATRDGSGVLALWDNGNVARAPSGTQLPSSDPIGLKYGPNQQPVALDVTKDGKGFWVASTGQFVRRGSMSHTTGFKLMPSGHRWSPCLPITWFHNAAHAPPGSRQMFHDAFAYLAELTGLPFSYGGETTQVPRTNRTNGVVVVGWSGSSPAGGWAQVGWTTTQFGRRNAWGWVELDARQAFTRPITFRPGGFGGIALHEIGHVIGLAHPEPPSEDLLMSNGPRGYVGLGDRAGFARLDDRHGC